MLLNFAPVVLCCVAGGAKLSGASRLAYIHIYMLLIFICFVGIFNIWPFLYKIVSSLSQSFCLLVYWYCLQLSFSFVYVFYCRVLIFGVALQPMLADCLLSGYFIVPKWL